MFHYVLFPIVIRQFLAGLDISERDDKNAISDVVGFAVRPAAVIDIARDILAAGSVNRNLVSHFEQVHSPTAICLLSTDPLASILDDTVATPDRFGGKQAQAGGRLSYAYGIRFHTAQCITFRMTGVTGPAI